MSSASQGPLPRVAFITGTDTGVGKTVVCAALAVALAAAGRTVAVYKPTQAGVDEDGGDIDRVRRLAGVRDVHEGIRLPYPMAPVAAAARAGTTLPSTDAHAAAIRRLAANHDHTLVEGAGGLLVQLDHHRRTLADIATATTAAGSEAVGAIVVCRAALGTINHTELTIEALSRRRIALTGLVIGSWPDQPTDIELSNRDYLNRHPVPLLAAVPEQAGQLEPPRFRTAAPEWFYRPIS